MGRQAWFRIGGFAVLVAAIVTLSLVVGVPGVSRLRADFAQFGIWAGVVFAGLYALLSLTPLPAAVFTLAAGALFGIVEGVAVVVAGATAGAVIAFYLARVLGRDFVARMSGGAVGRFDERFARGGVWAVLAVRLVPVLPFAAVNYLSGLTSIRPVHYLVGTMIGILPASVAYVALGAYGSAPGSWPFLAALGALLLLLLGGGASGWWRRRRRAAISATPIDDAAGPTPT